MTEIRNSIVSGIVFGLFLGIFFGWFYNLQYALVAGPIAGLLFGISIYFFITSKAVKQQTQIDVNHKQGIILSGGANHFVNREAVGGKLHLLSDKLQFKSHHYNIQNHNLEIPLAQISQVNFFNSLGIIPNGLKVQKSDGKTEKFVVNNRSKWSNAIEDCMAKQPIKY